ncbi:hypothetical protein Tco_1312433 [Tanacetum coccineum]
MILCITAQVITRQFILALDYIMPKEMAGDGLRHYWGQALEKVTATDLFYLRSMDEGMAVNVPYLLAQYLFRHADRWIVVGLGYLAGICRRLAEHFELVIEEGL